MNFAFKDYLYSAIDILPIARFNYSEHIECFASETAI